jgi:acetolactate synthase-1/2/3 large subunit
MSESPVVLLSGHAPRSQAGRGAFQEIDQVGAARPVSKAAWVVESAERMGEEMTRALALASAWPPGPVHLSLPGDLLEARVTTASPATPAPSAEPRRMDDVLIRRTLELLAEARRPLIIAGPAMGRARRSRDVERLSELTGIPALLMESPRGVNDPSLRGGTRCLSEADLVLLLGKRLDFTLRFGGPPAFSAHSRFIVVDVAPPRSSERLALALAANPSVVVRQLVADAAERVWQRSTWTKEVEGARATMPASWEELRRSSATPLHPLRVCAELQLHLDAGAVLVSDGGEFGQWCQAGLEARYRLINGPAGSIGSGVPMALGAKLARPDLPVIATLGDGTFGFHALEFDTAVRHGIPIVAIVGNDARWNAEHQLQLQQYGAPRAVGCALRPTRYDRVVEPLGGHGEHVERADELAPALARAARSGKPACVNVMIDGVAAPLFSGSAGH